MSIKNWNAGIIRPVAVAPTGPYQNSAAPGMWTLDQAAYWIKQGLWPTFGNVNPDAFIENLFSTYLYTGNGSTQTITNGIDLVGKGGLVWFKPRSTGNNHNLIDNSRGLNKFLITNDTAAQGTTGAGYGVASFNSTGFSLDPPWTSSTNTTGTTQVAWTFREQQKFFDVVTYTTVSGAMTIPHNLGSVPGCWIIKSYSAGSAAPDWWVTHRSIPSNVMRLNGTSAVETGFSTATSTNINISAGVYGVGETIVIYLFAHDAGGFGLSGNENVVSCGSYTGNGSATGPVVTLGYEPQWLMIKRSSAAGNWVMLDVMRGFSDSSDNELYADLALEEGAGLNLATPLATGFQLQSSTGNVNGSGSNYIYVAIRRGPMAVPTLGTTVFSPNTYTGSGSSQSVTTNFPVDLNITKRRTAVSPIQVTDRLRGSSTTYYNYLRTNDTDAETTGSTYGFGLDNNTAYVDNLFSTLNSGSDIIGWNFRRAPSFFDEVCYTGNGASNQTLAHNLRATPELMLVKRRSANANWVVTNPSIVADTVGLLNSSNAFGGTAYDNGCLLTSNTSPTTEFRAGFGSVNNDAANASGSTYVAYLFATCAGVSKVGIYTGTGTTQVVACGFTTGARYVLIKRTDSTGDWYVWDSARGIVSGNDPYLLLNSTAAEVTSTDYIDTSAAGFEITSTAPAAINANGGSYIFLAIS